MRAKRLDLQLLLGTRQGKQVHVYAWLRGATAVAVSGEQAEWQLPDIHCTCLTAELQGSLSPNFAKPLEEHP